MSSNIQIKIKQAIEQIDREVAELMKKYGNVKK